MDRPIRIALVGLAPLMRDVVTDMIASQADMRVACVFEHVDSDSDTLMRESIDVLLLGIQSSAQQSECETLLGATMLPHRVVGISSDGRRMMVSELRPTTTAFGSLTPDELLNLMRREISPVGDAHIAD